MKWCIYNENQRNSIHGLIFMYIVTIFCSGSYDESKPGIGSPDQQTRPDTRTALHSQTGRKQYSHSSICYVIGVFLLSACRELDMVSTMEVGLKDVNMHLLSGMAYVSYNVHTLRRIVK